MNELQVKVQQTPGTVTWNYEDLKKAITNALEVYKTTEYDDSNIGQAKKDRAMLNNLSKSVNARKIEIKGKKETVRHTICISDGCLEEIAEYPTKERCLQVLKDFCGAHENECYTVEFFDVAAQATRPAMYKKNIVYEFPAE